MSSNYSINIMYPFFRLIIAFSAGIFISDRLLPDSFPMWILLVVLGSSLMGLFLSYFYSHKFCSKYFGGFVLLVFMSGGTFWTHWRAQQLQFNWPDKTLLYEGTILEPPSLTDKTYACKVYVEKYYDDSLRLVIPVHQEILLYTVRDSLQNIPDTGVKLLFYAQLEPPSTPPYLSFDYARYLYYRGITATGVAYWGHWKVDTVTPVNLTCRQYALQCREKLAGVLKSSGLRPDVLAVTSALLLGEKDLLTEDIKTAFNAAGVSHVLAISGLHIGIIYFLLLFLLRPLLFLPAGRWLHTTGILFALWFFAFLTGLVPSVVRAVCMTTVYLLSSLLIGQRSSTWHVLYLTAFLMLVYQPFYLFDVGFQLSFAAVFSILLFYSFFRSKFPVGNTLLSYLYDTIAVTLAAQTGTFPLICCYFGTFPLYFIIGNLFVAPLVVLITVLTLLVLGLSWIPLIQGWVVLCLNFLSAFFVNGISFIASLPYASIADVGITSLQAVLLSIILFAVYFFYRFRRPQVLITLLISLNIFGLLKWKQTASDTSPQILFHNREVYYKEGTRTERLVPYNACILSVGGVLTGKLSRDYRNLYTKERPLRLDYLFLCKGFKGELNDLRRLFVFKKLVMDSSLPAKQRIQLAEQCKNSQTDYVSMEKNTVYTVPVKKQFY